jgi:hypothetical protein
MRKGWKKGWKIVRHADGGRLVSMTGDEYGIDPRDALYAQGKDTVTPEKGGPLAVFTDRDKAIEYAGRQGAPANNGLPRALSVWECTYLPTERVNDYGFALWAPTLPYMGTAPIYGMRVADLPDGTACADAVRLTRLVLSGAA